MKPEPVVAFVIVIAALVLTGCGAARQPSLSRASADRLTADRSSDAHAPRAVTRTLPSPRSSPTAQAWGYCGNIRGPADARSLVASGDADALVDARLSGATVTSYRVLAGHVSGLRALGDGVSAPRGRYLLLLGGTSVHYYAAFGYYGMYRIVGERAYQLCAYGTREVARGGITNINGIVKLLRDALRKRARRP